MNWVHEDGTPVVASPKEARLWLQSQEVSTFWKEVFTPSRETVTWSSSES